MDDIILFFFGLVATILAIGPLAYAAISESNEKRDNIE